MTKTFFQWSVWPLCLAAQTTPIVVAALFAPQALSQVAAATTVVLLCVLLAIEQLLPYRADWSVRGDHGFWRDIGHSVLYATIGGTVSQLIFVSGSASVLSRCSLAHGLGLWPIPSPFVVQVLMVVVVGDLLEYWRHRLAHTVPWLWSVHAVHHTPVRLHALKGPRHHVCYYLGRGLFVWAPLLLIGAPSGLIVWQFVAVVLAGAPAHANIAFRLPAFVHRLLVTPEFHRLHHSIDARQGNSNYATVFPLWDIIFGTHTDPLATEARAVGIERDPIPRQFLSELLSPVILYRLIPRRPSRGMATIRS